MFAGALSARSTVRSQSSAGTRPSEISSRGSEPS